MWNVCHLPVVLCHPKTQRQGLFFLAVLGLYCSAFFSQFEVSSSYSLVAGHMAYHCSRFSCCEALALACPSPTPRACLKSCPPSWWGHQIISSSVVPSSHLQSFPAWGSVPVFVEHNSVPPLCVRWPNYWSFSFSISPSNGYSGLISFWMDWFDFIVQGNLKSLLQHHSLKASVLQHSAFFMVQISHPYMTTGKIIALPTQAFIGKAVSSFNMLYKLRIVLITISCTVWQISVRSSSGTLSDLIPWICLSPSVYNRKGFGLGHTWTI